MSHRLGLALGALTTSEQISLETSSTRVHAVLDEVQQRMNIALSQGIDVGASIQDVYDAIRSGLNRLVGRVERLDSTADIAAWEAELLALAGGADQLNADVQASIAEATSSGKVQIGLWVGAAVLGSIGLVLGVRWYSKRRRR